MPEINKKIGMKIRRLRKACGLSQIALAEKIDLSFQQVQKYEKGFTAISVFRLQQIADALGVPISAFLEEENQGLKVSGPTLDYESEKSQAETLQFLSKEEVALLKLFRKMGNKKLRQGVLQQLKGLIELEREK